MKNRKSFWGGVLTGILAVALLAGCVYLGNSVWLFYSRTQNVSVQESAEGVSENTVATQNTLNKLDVIEETIEKYYLESVDEQTLEDGIYKGLVEALGDPYSTYYAPDELAKIQEKTEGIYYGIGAYIGIDTDTSLPRLSGIIDGTPAQESGLRAGDLIYQVDGTDVQGMELEEVTSLVKGEEGTTVHLTIIREGESDYLEMDVVRRQVESPTVNQEMLDDRIGYIQITEENFEDFKTNFSVLSASALGALIPEWYDLLSVLRAASPVFTKITAETEYTLGILRDGVRSYYEVERAERENGSVTIGVRYRLGSGESGRFVVTQTADGEYVYRTDDGTRIGFDD